MRRHVEIVVWAVVALLGVAPREAVAQGVTNFSITVPKKSAAGQLPINLVKVAVTLATNAPVAFNIQWGAQAPVRIPSSGTLAVGDTPPDPVEICGASSCPPNSPDQVKVIPPSSTLGPNDPARRRWIIQLRTNSDYDLANSCQVTMSGNETWKISIASGPNIIGACAESFDLNSAGSECLLQRAVPKSEPLAAITGFPGACGTQRPPVDLILVLDKSGSMSSPTMGGTPRSKMQALASAVQSLVDVWDNVRAADTLATKPDDKLGMVFFDDDARWMNTLNPAGSGWNAFSPGVSSYPNIKAPIRDHIGKVSPGGSTSMGDGLLAAANIFGPNPERRQVILLMSNGMENTDARVKVNNPTTPTQVLTYNTASPGTTTQLPNAGNYQVYAVTVGTSTAVSADINEDIATATKGFYINTEDDADKLSPFFAELLQNFVKFNTWETARMVSDALDAGTPYSTTLAVPSTTEHLLFQVTSPNPQAFLRLTATPPGGGPALVATGVGKVLKLTAVPPVQPYTAGAAWTIAIDAPRMAGGEPGSPNTRTPFDLVVLTEDGLITSDLTYVPQDYAPGNKVQLRASVKYRGEAVTGLGSDPADRVLVQLVKPGQSIGDLLSSATAPATQPTPGDSTSPANAKLQNLLKQDPAALKKVSETVSLVDDGKPEHGDSASGDGIYSALYPADKAGHYNFLFGVEGKLEHAGRFSRQQLKTVHVRDVPAPGNTAVSSTIAGQVLTVVFTPRNVSNDRMGPGWANYFWLTAGAQPPVKPLDNLDGTYRATINFTGSSPGPVTLHFVRVSQNIGDEDTPATLGIPLGDSTKVIADVTTTVKHIPWWVWLVALAILVLLVLLLRKKP